MIWDEKYDSLEWKTNDRTAVSLSGTFFVKNVSKKFNNQPDLLLRAAFLLMPANWRILGE